MSKRGENMLVNVGQGNMLMVRSVVSMLPPESAPLRPPKEDAKERNTLLDATQGRRTRSLIITDGDHVILSAVQVETQTQQFSEGGRQ